MHYRAKWIWVTLLIAAFGLLVSACVGAAGLNCWDIDGNGKADPFEDFNADGNVDVLDCRGLDGDPGETGAVGPQGPQGPSGREGENAIVTSTPKLTVEAPSPTPPPPPIIPMSFSKFDEFAEQPASEQGPRWQGNSLAVADSTGTVTLVFDFSIAGGWYGGIGYVSNIEQLAQHSKVRVSVSGPTSPLDVNIEWKPNDILSNKSFSTVAGLANTWEIDKSDYPPPFGGDPERFVFAILPKAGGATTGSIVVQITYTD